jgi:hypothetical protein
MKKTRKKLKINRKVRGLRTAAREARYGGRLRAAARMGGF